MNLMQEPIRLRRPQTFKQKSFQGPVEHVIPYQNILHGLESYPSGCPPSRILQVIEDIGSPVSRFQKLNLHIDSIGCFLVARSHLCQIIGFVIQSPAYPVEIDVPESTSTHGTASISG